jgi:transcriptional regulator with XRE-family HTH domain
VNGDTPAPDPIARSLGREIRQVREASGTSMRALAARCGISQPFLSAVERGLSMPSIATLYRIAEALDVAPSSLLPDEPSGDVHVIRHDEGRMMPSNERTGSAVGRLVLSDEGHGLEIYEYVTDPTADLDVGMPTRDARCCT